MQVRTVFACCAAVVSMACVHASGGNAQNSEQLGIEWTLDSANLWQDSGGDGSSDSFDLRGSYALSNENVFGDPEILWPGFVTGMRSSTPSRERFAEPIGNSLYFESPFIDTNIRMLYLYHDFPTNSAIGGGDLNVWAAQVRFALTDRLAIIAPKDGWSDLNAGILPENSGWNDATIGLKYAFIVNEEIDYFLTGGLRWEWHNGESDVLQGRDGGNDELSPFISVAKAWGRYNFMANITGRIPLDDDEGNYIVSWDLHLDTEIAPDVLPGFHPLIEIHALHYLSDGDSVPINVGGLDFSNIGATDVSGNNVFWGDIGFRWKLTPNLSWGAAYGFPISNPGNSILNQRVTVDFVFRF
jgi:hypothetical protein